MVSLGDLPGGRVDSIAKGISADGATIVGYGEPSSYHNEAYRWRVAEGMVGLGYLPGGAGGYSEALGVSGDGSVIVGESDTATSRRAFRYTDDTGMVDLGVLPGYSQPVSRAEAVSADGTTVVGTAGMLYGDYEAFIWTEEAGMVGLGSLPGGSRSKAWDVSADGSVVVGYSRTGDFEATIWDEAHGARRLSDVLVDDYGLDLGGWDLVEAQGISADGRTIVGIGYNEVYQMEAWIAHIPEPATAPLLLLAAAWSIQPRLRGPGRH